MVTIRRARAATGRAPVAALLALTGFAPAQPAAAALVVNTTFNAPAYVLPNPCMPSDVVALHGTIHVVISVTEHAGGGYNVDSSIDEIYSGEGIPSGVGYRASRTTEDSFYAGAPFPVVHTSTLSDVLVGQGGAVSNTIVLTDMHITVNAAGVPTATVDNWRLECRG